MQAGLGGTGLAGKLRRGWFVATDGLVAGLREVKDEIEIDQMREAAALGCRLFDQVLEHVVAGATEMEVAMALEYMARLAGGGADELRDDCGGRGAERAAAWTGNDGEAAEAGICGRWILGWCWMGIAAI